VTAAVLSLIRPATESFKAANDEDLIALYRSAGDSTRQDILEELFRRHHSRVVARCLRFTRDRESALDLAQEILLRAFRNLENYRGDCRFSTWLYVITRNLCMTAVQRRATEPVWAAKAIDYDLPDPTANEIHSNIEMEEARARCWRLILDTLNETEAKVMMLHYGREISLGQVSRMLGLKNKSGAKAYIVSAKRKLNAARLSETAHSPSRATAVAAL
jgi:RNA polymerase sigma-70 factor (ECF subfamily)